MSHTPKVSVCIPTYNRSQYLREAIKSVLIQSFTDFELIICDNASSDNTNEVVNSFYDDRISYYRNPTNLGAFKNINLCLQLAKGKYITIFHDDDVMLPDNILKKFNFLEKNPAIGLVDSNAYLIDDYGNAKGIYWQNNVDHSVLGEGDSHFKKLFLGYNSVCFPAVMIRKECYTKLGGFVPIPYCDWELWMRISLFYRLGYIQEPLIKYRRHANNDSLNYIGFKEEYDAKISIVNKYGSKISEVLSLKHDMQRNICRRIVDFSFSNLSGSYKSINIFWSLLAFSISINSIASTTYIFSKLLGLIRVKMRFGQRVRFFLDKVTKNHV